MNRVERVAELIKEEVSRIIREDVNDPRIGFVSLTRVDISPDLELARIGISILANEKEKTECMIGLTSATRFIRGKLGELLTLRFVPQLQFVRDDSWAKGSKVLNIISKLNKDEHNSRYDKTSPKKS